MSRPRTDIPLPPALPALLLAVVLWAGGVGTAGAATGSPAPEVTPALAATGGGASVAAGAAAVRPVAAPRPPAKAASRPWSRARLRAAEPADLPADTDAPVRSSRRSATARTAATGEAVKELSNPAAAPFRMHGRLFYRQNDEDRSCSATAIRSRLGTTVVTAGHCVVKPASETVDGEPAWSDDLLYIPGYRGGDQPFGQFPARAGGTVTLDRWRDLGDRRFDLAMVSLEDEIQPETGARRVDLEPPADPGRIRIFGYPAAPAPWDGELPVRCDPDFFGFDVNITGPPVPFEARNCDIAWGSSGGAWIRNGRFLFSVTAYGYCNDSVTPPTCSPRLYGPQPGAALATLYNSDPIGGTAVPNLRVIERPPARTRKRAVRFRLAGSGSTRITRFRVRLNGRAPVVTRPSFWLRKLQPGRYVIRIRSIDQTGRISTRTAKKTFRVLPRR